MTFPVFDSHVDTLLALENANDFLQGSPGTHVDMPRASAAGVRTLVMALCAEPAGDPVRAFEAGIGRFMALRDSGDIELLLMLEGCEPLAKAENPDGLIDTLRVATLTWNGSNSYAGGIGSDSGITQKGVRLAEELRGRGVLLDVSHLNDRSREQLLGMGIPCTVATHCNCRALHEHPRNLPDTDLLRIAELGGVTGINLVPDFLGAAAGMNTVADHLEHAVAVSGEDHVGMGSDLDGTARLPEGIHDCSFWPSFFDLLAGRGWTDDVIRKVADSNWRRVLPCSRTADGGPECV